jgi:hypothetical protein
MRIRGVSQVSGEHRSHKMSRPPINRLDRNPLQPKPLTIAPDTSIAPHLPYPNAYRVFSQIGRSMGGHLARGRHDIALILAIASVMN